MEIWAYYMNVGAIPCTRCYPLVGPDCCQIFINIGKLYRVDSYTFLERILAFIFLISSIKGKLFCCHEVQCSAQNMGYYPNIFFHILIWSVQYMVSIVWYRRSLKQNNGQSKHCGGHMEALLSRGLLFWVWSDFLTNNLFSNATSLLLNNLRLILWLKQRIQKLLWI